MTQNPDLIRELIDRLLAAADAEGKFTEFVARSVEVQFRREFNGAEFYIGCRKQSHPQEVKDAAVNQYKKRPACESNYSRKRYQPGGALSLFETVTVSFPP